MQRDPQGDGIGPVTASLPLPLDSRWRWWRASLLHPHSLGDEQLPHPDGRFHEEQETDAEEDHLGDCGSGAGVSGVGS
jgi:hypothetical protein